MAWSNVLNCAYLCLLQLAERRLSASSNRIGKHLVFSGRRSVRGHRVQTGGKLHCPMAWSNVLVRHGGHKDVLVRTRPPPTYLVKQSSMTAHGRIPEFLACLGSGACPYQADEILRNALCRVP